MCLIILFSYWSLSVQTMTVAGRIRYRKYSFLQTTAALERRGARPPRTENDEDENCDGALIVALCTPAAARADSILCGGADAARAVYRPIWATLANGAY
jgi:hypothetical protein